MPETTIPPQDTCSRGRLYSGFVIFASGWLCPLLIPLVTISDLSTAWKTLMSGFLLVGAPEVLTLLAIVILGKAGYNYLKSRVLALAKRAAPSARVSRTRYRIGLILLLPHVVFAYLIFYAPEIIPGYDVYRIHMNLTADAMLVVTLFILGGDFWEKLRALFVYEARVCFLPKGGDLTASPVQARGG